MSLTEMRRAIETRRGEADGGGSELDDIGEGEETDNPRSRLPPAERGVKQTRSCIVELEMPDGTARARKGTLTFSNTVGQLSRAGSSREGGPGGGPPQRPMRRAPPTRAVSCIET